MFFPAIMNYAKKCKQDDITVIDCLVYLFVSLSTLNDIWKIDFCNNCSSKVSLIETEIKLVQLTPHLLLLFS